MEKTESDGDRVGKKEKKNRKEKKEERRGEGETETERESLNHLSVIQRVPPAIHASQQRTRYPIPEIPPPPCASYCVTTPVKELLCNPQMPL